MSTSSKVYSGMVSLKNGLEGYPHMPRAVHKETSRSQLIPLFFTHVPARPASFKVFLITLGLSHQTAGDWRPYGIVKGFTRCYFKLVIIVFSVSHSYGKPITGNVAVEAA
jgi:hypothetical protein